MLDIDGVLNRGRTDHIALGGPYNEILPEYVLRLEKILEQTDCDVCVCSVWRGGHTPHQIFDVLSNVGLPGKYKDRFIGSTPYSSPHGYERGFQCADWLRAHPQYDRVVCLDDSSDYGLLKVLLVQTSLWLGVQDWNIHGVESAFENHKLQRTFFKHLLPLMQKAAPS